METVLDVFNTHMQYIKSMLDYHQQKVSPE